MNRQERLERTMSMAQNKGLLNNPGENNCFLNSAVQVFWHLDVFRRSFREIKGHFCMGKSCIFCALENIFKEFQYSSNDALPPDTLRIAMATTFRDQRKFQMGDMDDAAECFETILSRLHFHLVMSEHDDGCNSQHCITHQKFAMHLIEQTICHCGERSEPLPFFQTVHYVSASALCAEARKNERHHKQEYDFSKHFGTLLRQTGEDTRLCNGQDCGQKIQVQRLLLNCPDIISIGLSWDSESPDAEHIGDVLQCIGTTLKLTHIFHQVSSRNAQQSSLNLVGLVTYYGKHYSTFFFHSKLKTWIYFDDAKVREIGPDWSVIREKCRRCHYQPLLLLYANPNGRPINPATAPKEKIFINPSTIVRKSEISPMSRRISTEVNRHDYERYRKRSRPSSPESGLVESDSESNFSTLKSESKSNSNKEGSNDTLKARDNKVKIANDNDEDTLKAQNHNRTHRKDMVSLKDDKSPKSRRSKSCDWLDDGAARSNKSRIRNRAGSTGSDVTDTLKRKHREKSGKNKKTGLRRIGSAIFQAMRPAVAISMKTSKKKSKDRTSISSTQSNGELSPSSQTSNQDGLRMNDQAQLDDYLRSPSHDSGIGSAAGSVSSSDTNHGGSDDDLVEYSQTLHAMKNGYGMNGKVNGRSKKAPQDQHHERCAYLLQEAENLVLQSQKAEKSSEYLTALRFCTDANTHFRRAAEESGPSSNNGRYALMKADECKKKCDNLREKFEAQSYNKMTRKLSPEDELLRTHRRDEIILKQQQQNHAQFGTLPRNVPTYKQIYPPPPPSLSVPTKIRQEDAASVKSDSRIMRPFQPPLNTLPVKPKRNSNHYINRSASAHINDRGSDDVCTQKIKPDSMCYNPNHYEDITGRMQGLSVHQTNGDVERRRSGNYSDFGRSGDRRSVYDNVVDTEQPRSSTERRISAVTKIYLQPSAQRLSKSYDGSRYSSPEQEQFRQPKVYYQGALDNREQSKRSKSYGNVINASQAPYNPPNYKPSPPSYQSYQQAKTSTQNTAAPIKPWYQDEFYPEQFNVSSPSNLRAISAKMIPDKLVCERCCQIPVSRTQRICAVCEQETYQRHKLPNRTDMLY